MNVLFTLCGRAGSKGIKNKNLRVFCGKPLVYYAISVIDLYLKRNSNVEYSIVINSDSKELRELVSKNRLKKIEQIERDTSLSGDLVGKVEVIRDCLEKMEDYNKCKYDIVIDLDITSPLRTEEDLECVVNTHILTGADVTTTVASARRNPYFNQVKRTEKGVKRVIESGYTARQQAPEIFDMNASIYAYKPDYLKSGKGVLEGYCEVVEMYDTGILDLDHENDFRLMEIIAGYLFKNEIGFKEVYDNIREE